MAVQRKIVVRGDSSHRIRITTVEIDYAEGDIDQILEAVEDALRGRPDVERRSSEQSKLLDRANEVPGTFAVNDDDSKRLLFGTLSDRPRDRSRTQLALALKTVVLSGIAGYIWHLFGLYPPTHPGRYVALRLAVPALLLLSVFVAAVGSRVASSFYDSLDPLKNRPRIVTVGGAVATALCLYFAIAISRIPAPRPLRQNHVIEITGVAPPIIGQLAPRVEPFIGARMPSGEPLRGPAQVASMPPIAEIPLDEQAFEAEPLEPLPVRPRPVAPTNLRLSAGPRQRP